MTNLTHPNHAADPAGEPITPRRHRVERAGGVLTLLAAIALAAPALVFLGVRLAVPSDRAHLLPGSDAVTANGVIVSPLKEGPLAPGDLVTAIEGVPVSDLARRWVGGRGSMTAPDTAAGVRTAWRRGATVRFEVLRAGERLEVPVVLGSYPLGAVVARTWGTIVFALVTLVIAGLVFARRPHLAPARVLFVGAGALLGATTWSLGLQTSDFVYGTGFWLYQLTTVVIFMTYWTTIFHFAAVFPEPLPWARHRLFVPGVYGVPLLALGAFVMTRLASEPEPLVRIATLAPVSGYHAAVMLAAGLLALLWQLRRPRDASARRQIRWVVFGALVTGSAGLFLYILPPLFGWDALPPNAIGPVVTLFPVAVAIAVLRDNLFDIDTLLNRTLVYATLTLTIGAAYAVLVSGASILFQTRGGLGPSLVATGVIAVAFHPLRQRIQRVVNRLTYGERDDPGAVLGRLGQRLEGTLHTDAVLPTLAETVAQALRLPFVALTLDGTPPHRVTYGRSRQHRIERFPLVRHNEPIGMLEVEHRGPDESFGRAEWELLETIARQASVAAYAVRASDDLRRSRERLVAAREEERRRLRRDLHDGLGPALGGLTLKLDATANLLERDPEAARRLLDELRDQARDAVHDLRSVIHALRPPTLDDLGLVGAIGEQALQLQHADIDVAFDASDSMPSVPAGVEVAAFRIVQEALANVVRHAEASRCWVRLDVDATGDGTLVVVVEDDGVGVRPGAGGRHDGGSGVGLASMRARASDLGGHLHVAPRAGGGTRVVARLPLRAPEGSFEEGSA